jgi:D-alanyl-D-alanine carboxypeptidase
MRTGSRTARVIFPVLAAALVLVATTAGLTEETSGVPPVERRADELFDILRAGDTGALRTFVEQALHPSFFEMGPVDFHVEQFGEIRATLGDFDVDDIRISGPHRGDFVLRSESGAAYVLHLETEPIAPFRLAGVGLRPYNPERDIPEYSSLDEADAHLRRLAGDNEFSGVVLVAREGEPDWVRAYGMANKEKGIPNTPQTRFDVGSITKTLTGVAVMQLVERGKIDLEAPMSRYLGGFPPEIADRVRVIDLLRMESGYGDYYTRAFQQRREEFVTIPDYLELFRTFSLEFEPGTDRRYSNVGYVILGGVVERVSGLTYHDYVRKYIFEPAGMSGSSFRGLVSDDPLAAVGYTNDGPSGERGYVETNRSILDLRGNPSGGSFSSAADLLRFNRQLRDNRLLSEANTTFVLNLYEQKPDRPATRGVAGGAPGVSAVSLEDTDAGVTVIVLSNYDEPLAEDVGKQIFRMLRGGDGSSAVAAVMPMRIINSQPAVEVMVEGEGPFLFLIDTGAAGAGVVSRELAERLDLETVGQVEIGDPSDRNRELRDIARVAELTAGGQTWRDLDMLLGGDVLGDPGIDGILGFGMFGDRLLTLDYPAGEVRVESGELAPADSQEILDFRIEHGIPMIDLSVANHTVEADIDSGSMGWLMVPESVAEGLPLDSEPQVIGHARTSFNEFDIKAATLVGEVRVGRHTVHNPQLEFADIFPRANVGGQFLSLFAVTFDQKNNRVRFARQDEGCVARKPRYRVGVMLRPGPEGLIVDGTAPGSPAERAGIVAGDRLSRVNGIPVDELARDEMDRVFGTPEEITLVVERDGEDVEVRLTPEKAP